MNNRINKILAGVCIASLIADINLDGLDFVVVFLSILSIGVVVFCITAVDYE